MEGFSSSTAAHPSRSTAAPRPAPLQLDNLILWTSPAKSGAALGVATVVFGILQFATVNLVAVGAYAALFAVLSAFVYGNLAGFLH